MENDDESSLSPTPDDFLLSTYKGNLFENMSEIKQNEKDKLISSYKCYLCQHIHHNPILTCETCVNAGRFSSLKHDIYSNKRRKMLLDILNKLNYEEFQKYLTNTSIHMPYSERLLLLKKINSEKTILQSEFQTKYQSSIETRQISDEIQVRKQRRTLIHHSIQQLREQIESKKQDNIKIRQQNNDVRSRIEIIKGELDEIKKDILSSNEEMAKKIDLCMKNNKRLLTIRRERIHELTKYIFPVQYIPANEDVLAARIKALSDAQQTMIDNANTKQTMIDNTNKRIEDKTDIKTVAENRYQIVQSFLPNNGDYQVDNLVSIYNVNTNIKTSDERINEPDSPQLSPSCDSYEILSGLSHACQLINVIAFYLQIYLPFRLHQLEFNTDNLIADFLRSDIAKLNTNIIACCLSQGISIESINVAENLLKLVTCKRYPSRQQPVIYSSKYIEMLDKEIKEINRIIITEYQVEGDNEDNDNDEKDVADILKSYEWETIPENDYIVDDGSFYEQSDSSPSTSTEQAPSRMSDSIDYLKTKSSAFINSFFRNGRT